ncbi:hypothetical protein ACERII_10825 [Evansella sp. AB-rgal1]|uniref:hypothetical protein n=1 Tax=Evansella sp. AB-rgal1 TaxID=3242696 RepID=UPI00359CDCEF
MKKRYWGFLILVLSISVFIFIFSSNRPIDLSVNAEDVRHIDIFTGSVPASAEKKSVTKSTDIEEIINLLNEVTIKRKASENYSQVGGIGMYFEFHLENGENAIVHLSSETISTKDGFFKTNKVPRELDDEDTFWKSLSYESVNVKQDELP